MKENLNATMVAFAVLFSTGAFAQTGSVGINTTTPDPSAVLDVVSITKGILPPRMTNDQLKAIVNPAEGLTAYNTTLKCLVTYINGSYSCSYNAPAQAAPTAPLGSTYTAHYNGIVGGVHDTTNPADPTYYTLSTYTTATNSEPFSGNTTCATKEISAQGCGGLSTVTGASGRVYNLVNINGQCWFKENLNEVPSNFSSYNATSWLASSPGDQGYWGYYNTTDATGNSGWGISEPATSEGLLYQWNAAMDNSVSERSRGICPTGFHIPSDCEWMYLEHGQGMAISEQNLLSVWRSNTADNQGTPGNKLCSQGAGQTNASGFSGLVAGYREPNGTFLRAWYGYWWSSSAAGATTAIYRLVSTGDRGVIRSSYGKASGFSVRCLKD